MRILPLALAALTLAFAARPAIGASLEDHVERYFRSGSATAEQAEIATLRAAGPAGLDAIVAVEGRQEPELAQADWTRLYDAVGGQRGCRASHLYWYTDLAQAEAAARDQGRPIVSLRLLGRLTDEYSCANSRFFRAILYSDAQVASWLRDHVILHWSSERPVPLVTIDFGDGRVLRTTLTGNSAHYVLDADGRPIDALPGLYGPHPFLAHLQEAVACAQRLREQPAHRAELLAAFHRDALARQVQARSLMALPGALDPSAVAAERLTRSKSVVELSLLAAIGMDVDDPDPQVHPIAQLPMPAVDPDWGALGEGGRAAVEAQLAAMRALIADPNGQDSLVRVQARVARDTRISEYALHAAIHQRFADGQEGDFAALNAWVYATVFRTPARDPWLGLLPAAFDGLSHRDVGALAAAR